MGHPVNINLILFRPYPLPVFGQPRNIFLNIYEEVGDGEKIPNKV